MEDLPELPESQFVMPREGAWLPAFTPHQMRMYATAAVLAEREACAQTALSFATCGCNGVYGRCMEDDPPKAIAAAIRGRGKG